MFERISRWQRLTLFAVGNLLCWVALAVAAGLLIGDGVDLGVETLIRERQATVVAAWDQLGSKLPRPGSSQAPAASTAKATTGKAVATDAALWPTGAPQSQAGGIGSPTPTGTAQSQRAVVWPPTPTFAPSSLKATPQPTLAQISTPLLMSDPPISNLVDMNAEMSRSAPGRAVQIRYQETALNREVDTLLRKNPKLPYRNVKVDLKPDGVTVTGSVTVLGFQVSTKAIGTVRVRDCRPSIEVEAISIAGVLTPGFVKDEIKAMLLEALAWYPADYPLCLEEIVLEETRATIYGYRR